MAHPNEELVRKGYAAFLSGDIATLAELFADDIVWHSPGGTSLPATTGERSRAGRLPEDLRADRRTIDLEIHDVLANDDHVVVLVHSSAERSGKRLDDDNIQLFHVTDGTVTGRWLYPGDAYASDEFRGQG